MTRRSLLFVLALGVSGCLNDYDQFDFGPMAQTGSYDAGRPEGRKPDATRTDGTRDDGAGDASGDAGDARDENEVVDAQAIDGANDSEPGDAEPDAGARFDADAGTDAIEPNDAAGDRGVEPDASGTDDAPSDDGGTSDAEPELDASADASEDVSVPDDVSVTQDASVEADASVTPDGEAGDCGSGSKRCGTSCVSLDSPATGCGSTSCTPCDLPHAVARCGAQNECTVLRCAAGFDDCDGVAANGCEIALATDVNHCGACGRTCSDLHALSRECTSGVCTTTCLVGYANCDRPATGADNGCELAVSSDSANCGACGNDCRAQGGGLVCGVVPNRCGCDANSGCRTAQSTGSCDMGTGLCRCGPTVCREGETCAAAVQGPDTCSCNGSASCVDGETCCQSPAGCRNLLSDPSNCGACGRTCPKGLFCVNGDCACSANSHCDAGSSGTCSSGQCSCNGVLCPQGQRCQPGGQCG